MRRTTRTLSALSLTLVLAGTACGGGDSSGSALTDEAFCAKVAAMENMDPSGDDITAVTDALEELAAAAPTKELREALETLGPVMTAMSGIDENDPDAMNKAFEVMMDPEVIAAGELIEKYSSETCGIETTDESTDEALGEPSDTSPSFGSNGGYIFDDMSVDDVSDYVEANGADLYPNGYIGSTSISGANGYTEVTMDFANADSIDGVALCELIVEGIAMSSADTAVRIVVQENTVDVAVREVDGECTSTR
jgi:hypothetical protein